MRSAGKVALVRLLVALLVLLAVFTVTFFMMRLAPGGPFEQMEGLSPQAHANLERKFGLSGTLMEQYWSTLAGYATGDFGPSLSFAPGKEVKELLRATLPVSMELGFYALVIALLLGVAGGALSGCRIGSLYDRAATLVSLAVISASVIVVGALTRKLFITESGFFKLGGFDSFGNKALPSLALGLAFSAIFHRLVRANVARQMAGGIMHGATARGVGRSRAFCKYVLPQALIPMLEWMGPAVAGILTGSFVVEAIFEVPGVAACFVHGAQARDYTLVSGAIMVYTAFLMALNFTFEMLHVFLDPRARESGGGGG